MDEQELEERLKRVKEERKKGRYGTSYIGFRRGSDLR